MPRHRRAVIRKGLRKLLVPLITAICTLVAPSMGSADPAPRPVVVIVPAPPSGPCPLGH